MAVELLTRVRAEIEGRLAELQGAVDEYQRLLGAADALESSAVAAKPSRAGRRQARVPHQARTGTARAPRQARMGTVEKAVVAALEHGSHTMGELGVVTGSPAASLRGSLRRLLAAGKITRTSREGRAAYALSSRSE